MKKTILGLAIAGAVTLTASVDATLISVNFTESSGHANQQIAPGATAGLTGYVYDNWNNVQNPSGTLGSLVDSDANTTVAEVTWSSSGTWGDGTANIDADAGIGDARVARGYLDDGGSGVNISVLNIPYSEYEVVVYFSTDHYTGADPYAPITINGISNQTTGIRSLYESSPGWDGTDSVLQTGLTDSTLTILSARNGIERGSIAGFQIVQIPEPSTIGMVTVFGGGILFFRRKLRA